MNGRGRKTCTVHVTGSIQPAETSRRGLFLGIFLLIGVTGISDAVSFLGLGQVFTANMTGNVLLLGFAVGSKVARQTDHLKILYPIIALVFFVIGTVAGSAVIGRRGGAPRLMLGFALQFLALVAVTVLFGLCAGGSGSGLTSAQHDLSIALLSLAMGCQFASVRRMQVPDTNTTVLTTMLGSLAVDAVVSGGAPDRAGRRIGAIATFFLGALTGAFLVSHGLVWGATGALVLFVIAVGVLVVTGNLRRG
jgi:uncharacterized membrane protein YoaK (UPF0700 family)